MKFLRYATMAAHWLVLIFIILYIFTGLGITEYQVIEAATFGTLSKLTAFQLHNSLLVPFIVVLAFHIGLSFLRNHLKSNINVR